MLQDRDLVVFSDDWGRHPFSCQHLVRRLLPANRVIWVNSVGYRALRPTPYDLARAVQKMASWVRGARRSHGPRDPGEPLVLTPVFLPFGRSAAVRTVNRISTIATLRRTMERLAFRDPVVITTLPNTAGIVNRLGASAVIYYCVDDVTLWPGAHGGLARALEQELLEQVDLVVATSEKLRRTRRNGRRPTRLLTHGVDLDHFRVPAPPPGSPPVATYYGLIDERCDRQLLAAVARANPELKVRVIGTWRVDEGPLAGLQNVEKMGPVSYDVLPSRIADAKVLLLPYVVDELAQSINPLKLKEYLATGRPVVATPLPEVTRLGGFVRVAEGESFVRAVADAAAHGPAPDPAREAYLAGESWDAKAEELSCSIESVLAGELAA